MENFVASPENYSRISLTVAPSNAPDQATADAVIDQAYDAWKADYVTASAPAGFSA